MEEENHKTQEVNLQSHRVVKDLLDNIVLRESELVRKSLANTAQKQIETRKQELEELYALRASLGNKVEAPEAYHELQEKTYELIMGCQRAIEELKKYYANCEGT